MFRFHLHPCPVEEAAVVAERMSREGFEVFCVSAYAMLMPATGQLQQTLTALVCGRIDFTFEETPIEAEFKARLEALKNSRIIRPDLN